MIRLGTFLAPCYAITRRSVTRLYLSPTHALDLPLYARYLCSRDALGQAHSAKRTRPSARDDRVSCIQDLPATRSRFAAYSSSDTRSRFAGFSDTRSRFTTPRFTSRSATGSRFASRSPTHFRFAICPHEETFPNSSNYSSEVGNTKYNTFSRQ